MKPLETITKFEADRLVRDGIVRDVIDALLITCTVTIPAGILSPLWNFLSNDYKQRMGHQILEFQKLFPVPENIDYDKIFNYALAGMIAAGVYKAQELVHSAINSHQQHNTNPEKFIRENYNREIS